MPVEPQAGVRGRVHDDGESPDVPGVPNQPARRVDTSRRAHGHERVALPDRALRRPQRVQVHRLTEQHRLQPHRVTALRARRRLPVTAFVADDPSGAAGPHARAGEQVPVQVVDRVAPTPLVKIVDVGRHQRDPSTFAHPAVLPRRQRPVSGRRLDSTHLLTPRPPELPQGRQRAGKCFRVHERGDPLGPVVQATGPAEGRQARAHGDPRTGQDQHPLCGLQQGSDGPELDRQTFGVGRGLLALEESHGSPAPCSCGSGVSCAAARRPS